MARSRNPSPQPAQSSRDETNVEQATPFPRVATPSPPHSREESLHDWSEDRDSPVQDDFLGPRERDGSPIRQYKGPRSESPEGVHPGDSVFSFPDGGPVRLTGLTPISPTNEEVFRSGGSYQQNPQPVISVLSPRQSVGYPFLFSAGHPPIFSIAENEKYRKLMQKKQRRDNKKEKNVKQVMKAEDVAGYKGNENIDEVLQSLGENPGDNKKGGKKKVEKTEKPKTDKKGRRSVEKSCEEEETMPLLKDDEEEDEKAGRGRGEMRFQDPVVNELTNFSKNFYLVNPEPGDLRKHKSVESLGKSNESLNFTKVTSKKHRGKKGKEETGKPPPDKVDTSRRTSSYALRSRDVMSGTVSYRSGESGVSSPTSSVGSSSHIQPIDPAPPNTIYNLRHPIPVVSVKENKVVGHEIKITKNLDLSADFPALPGLGLAGGSEGGMVPDQIVVGAWSRPITVKPAELEKTVTSKITLFVDGDSNESSERHQSDDQENDSDEKSTDIAATSDNTAVISNHHPVPLEQCQNINKNGDSLQDDSEELFDDDDNFSDEIQEINEDKYGSLKVDIYADLSVQDSEESTDFVKTPELDPFNDFENGDENGDANDEDEDTTENEVDEHVEVVLTEEEFSGKPSRNPPVLILGENAEDWQSSEFSFGFDVNEELVARSLRGELTPVPERGVDYTPLTPIDTVDGAILSFGGPDGGALRAPLCVVGVPVGVPVPVSYPYPAGFVPSADSLPAPFTQYIGSPYVVPLPSSASQLPNFSDDTDLVTEQKTQNISELGEIHTVSPESGISSASPLSWQPDSSPSLCPAPCSPGNAPGSYPRHTPRADGSILHHVNESLENWSGPDSSVCSSRASPVSATPAQSWVSQVDMSLPLEDDMTGQDEPEDEGENISAEKMSSEKEKKFNYDQIVKYISESWSSVSKEVKTKPQAVRYYNNKSNATVVKV